ncbi:MBL fold metallo-hydrolase [Mumia sp. zg.B21]|uniref:alkyl/aryl-sulfatase n=1 Tax=unclassified Mumia TaxID=2621872 RepID=UPI001C6E9361|nr:MULTISPECIES: alkyl sulfatase dimerization domain-containing protein [unclassified Mumia]MBW9210215.1 MBL fold metallo-hydrolase [Mumia sp. zg.B21]MDD9349686.1 alkyl sulfatase dimerization domain-containing protein [Mumia sp.]
MAVSYSEDHPDFANADRGFVGTISPATITSATGTVVFDADALAFVSGSAPEEVHPSLWRQAKLTSRHGLYEVAPGFYQVRGFDISNMTLVEGTSGVIVIDPLVSAETAAAALALYREHRGDRPVSAVIYTHAHIDHFGGVLGVVDASTDVPILAPEHFLEHAVSENVYAGVAMLRRGYYYDGHPLDASVTGAVGIGLGPRTSAGTVGLLPPTVDITHTGQEETLDGVRIVFQLTPGTESPAEMNFSFPDERVLCMAENACHTMHNLLTLRGAQVRDSRIWSRYLAESIELFAHDSDVVFSSHHWPTWGTDEVIAFLTEQRDLYAYMHDQTLRLMNQGYVGSEIAEMLDLPDSLAQRWSTRGYYGSLSHNVKAVFQRYLGWYDGNPAHLWEHTPENRADRYVELLGGVDAVVQAVRRYADAGDLRFAAELGSHAVFADPDNPQAREALAEVLESLGLGAENATWRNCFLTGAHELRGGSPTASFTAAGMVSALTTTQLFDTIAIRLDGAKAAGVTGSIAWHFTDSGEAYRMELSNGALVHFPTTRGDAADLTLRLTRPQLLGLLGSGTLDGIDVDGDTSVLTTIVGLTDEPDPRFAVVEP